MGKKRFQTWFGVPIPPFKEEVYGSKSTTIRFVIKGNIPSKKNNSQAVTIRKNARLFAYKKEKEGIQPTWKDVHKAISMCSSKMRGNKEYLEFLKIQKPILQEQMKFWSNRLSGKGLVFPLGKATMTLKLHFKSKYITDTVNKQQSIQDLLVDAGVIKNDDYNSLNPIFSKSALYYEEITHNIAFISLTFNLK